MNDIVSILVHQIKSNVFYVLHSLPINPNKWMNKGNTNLYENLSYSLLLGIPESKISDSKFPFNLIKKFRVSSDIMVGNLSNNFPEKK